MSGFFWASGHLGWGAFALIAFAGLWGLLFDLVWRLVSIRIARLLIVMAIGWGVGVGLILLGFYVGSQ